jgi:zinc protease
MGLILVGPYDEKRKASLLKQLEKYFGAKTMKKAPVRKFPRKTEKLDRSSFPAIKLGFDVKTPTLAFAFRAPDLRHADVPALDIACQVLATGELSRLYQKLFYDKALATEVSGGMYVPSNPGMCWFQADVEGLDKIEPLAQEIFSEIKRLRDEGPSEEELSRVIVNAESEKLYAMQSADGLAGRIGFLKYVMGDLNFDRDYLEALKAVDGPRIQRVLREWFRVQRMSLVLLLPKAEEKKFDFSPVAKLAEKILGRGEVTQKALVQEKKKKIGSKLPSWIPSDPMTFTHSSGIKVAYQERGNSNCFSIHAAAMGGSRLELLQPIESREKDWGSSNLLAQTWTKGTCTDRGTKDSRAIAKIVEGSAASFEGFAGRNTVGLQMTGLLRDWTPLSSLMAEVLVSPAFENTEVEHSRRVTEDHLKSLEDHSSQLCTKLFLETLFEKHPYGQLTYGSLASLKEITPQKLRSFHHRWIRPDQLSIAVVGRVRRAQLDGLLDQVVREFEGAEKAAKAAGKSWISTPSGLLTRVEDESDLKAPRWVEKRLGREQTHILVGGLGTRVTSDERWALRVLQNILGGQSGRLFIELREKKSLAYTVAPTGMEGLERGWVGTYIACSPSKKDEAIAGIRKVLETLALKGPTVSELKRAREFYLGRRAIDQQGDGSTAASLGLEHLYGITQIGERHVLGAIEGVTGKAVQDFCRKYLVEQPMVTSIVG